MCGLLLLSTVALLQWREATFLQQLLASYILSPQIIQILVTQKHITYMFESHNYGDRIMTRQRSFGACIMQLTKYLAYDHVNFGGWLLVESD